MGFVTKLFGGGAPKAPPPLVLPEIKPIAPIVDTRAKKDLQRSQQEQRRRVASLIGGRESTVGTSPQGILTASRTARKSLLGVG